MARSGPLPHAHPTDRMVGNAPAIQSLRAQIRHLITFDTVGSAFVPTLLLQGETGTGKGLVARVIHDSGPRAQGPFVDVNCAAIPETLLEVELFGFEAGTFTDAKRAKPGPVESASRGTLFLDEIDALPLPLQAKLLSAIEEKRVRRLGAVASRQVDVKLITATAANLPLRAHEGRFRPDLYHRLAVVILALPPVRQRGADILFLAQHFLRQYAEAHRLVPKRFSRDAEVWLQGYDWPGNVRELSHLMERVILLHLEAVVTASILESLCLPQSHRAVGLEAPVLRDEAAPLDEPAQIRQALSQTGGNVVQAARFLKLNRGALRYRMRQYGIGRSHSEAGASSHNSQAQAIIRPSAVPRGRSPGRARPALEPAWEQKLVAGLAIDVIWPEVVEPGVLGADPWTLARRWQQSLVEKIHEFGGLIVQHSPSLYTAVFGIPQTLEQMPQRAVQAALAIRQQGAQERAVDERHLYPAVRMAVHLGQVLVDIQASDPTAQLLTQVEQGRGQVVGIFGEPGVGKSRLCYEVTQSQRPHNWLLLESSPVAYGKDTPYLPVIDLLKAYFQLDARDEWGTIRDKIIEELRRLDAELLPSLPALLTLLDVPVEDPQWHGIEPPQRRQRTLEACKRLLLRASQVQPLLLVIENLHWIDTETQAFLDTLVDSLASACIVLLVNYRPEYHQRWGSKTYYTQLRIDPLPSGHARELLQEILGKHPTLEPLLQFLITSTEGNPFFLEESVHTLVETGVLVGERGAYHLAQALPTMQMPTTVQAVLAARIDRLPLAVKRLLQTAAVIGTEVPLLLLQAIAELPEAAVHDSLLHLQAAEFMHETQLFPEHAYTFKHALTHEVAYGSLLQERRRALHARIVEVVEACYPDRLAEQVERLAHHALRGEVWEKALAYYRQAGDKAMARSAFRAAVACFEQALTALRYLPEQRHTQEQAIDLRYDLGNALQALGEFGRRFAYLREAETLAEALGDQRRLGQICTDLTHTFWTMGDHDNALACGQRALTLAAATGDEVQQAHVNGYLGAIYFSLGDYHRAMDVLRQAMPSYEGESHHQRFGGMMMRDARVRLWLLQCCAELGTFDEGIAYGEEAVQIAETAGHLTSAVMTQDRLGLLALRQGDLPYAVSMLEHALTQCRAADIPLFLPAIMATLNLAYAQSGQVSEALRLLDQIEIRQTTGGGSDRVMLFLGETYLLAGHVEDAHRLAERALALFRDRKERGNQAWALWLRGEIVTHHAASDVESAVTYYQQALALANELGMRPLQAHCHASLGTLYATTGRCEPARTELSAALDLYRSMEMTFWLPQTEATLAQVL